MPVGRIVRHSPLYLYLKLYSLSCLVSIFASRPVSGRIDAIASTSTGGDRRSQSDGQGASIALLRQTERVRRAAGEAFLRHQRGQSVPRQHPLDAVSSHQAQPGSVRQSQALDRSSACGNAVPGTLTPRAITRAGPSARIAYALKTLAVDADAHHASLAQPPAAPQRVGRALRRWGRRLRDMHKVKGLVRRDFTDVHRHPELLREAHVRCSRAAHPDEAAFICARAARASRNAALLDAMGITPDPNDPSIQPHPDDLPRVAVGGSGGGYRATFGFLGAIQGMEAAGMYGSVFWLGGVSGSCWTIAALYSVARCRTKNLAEHFKSVAAERLHPMSRRALDAVARSPKGVYFLLAPLLAKLRDGNVGIGIMDMYATLTTSYQLLSRSPHARPRLSRSTFACELGRREVRASRHREVLDSLYSARFCSVSRFWDRAGLRDGLVPMPILSAVRINPHRQTEHQSAAQQRYDHDQRDPRQSNGAQYQWWEINPLEVGSSDEGAWVPTWAFGRG